MAIRRNAAGLWVATRPVPAPVEALNAETFEDDFETGDTSNWSSHTATIVSGAAHTGSYGCRVTAAMSAQNLGSGTAKWDQSGHYYAGVRFWFRFQDLPAPGANAHIFQLQNVANTKVFDWLVNTATNKFRHVLGNSAGQDVTVVPEADRWYLFQARVFFGDTTFTSHVKVDGVELAPVSLGGMTASPMRAVRLGTASSTETFTLDIDEFKIVVADTDPGWVSQ